MRKLFVSWMVCGMMLLGGNVFAKSGYMVGDYAGAKLVPYFETGDARSTIIGIQNMSPQEEVTKNQNQRVKDLEDYLAGENPSQSLVDANLATADTVLDMDDLNAVATAREALQKAKMNMQIEHMFITVNAYDAQGQMMDGASATLCLAEDQFGYVILQGPSFMSDWQVENARGAVLSVTDGDIPTYGYVTVMAEDRKFDSCGEVAPNRLRNITTGKDKSGNDAADGIYSAMTEMATWAIIQDTGQGFFGTEVPTATVSMDADMMVDCDTVPDGANEAAFDMKKCGLMSEDSVIMARYDVGDETMVYLWLADGEDADDTKPSQRRMLDVVVKCEEGRVIKDQDSDGEMQYFQVAAADKVTMIDPGMGDLGDATAMCEGNRGLLEIMMPEDSHAGMVFSHITQLNGHYRMNFIGYSKDKPDMN